MNVIETTDLTKHYGTSAAVDAVSFTVHDGQVFGFLGPNGSGKTTTIAMVLGIITPNRGRLRVFGHEGERGLHQARQRIGATLEAPNFYLSGLDNLRIAANIKRTSWQDMDASLKRVGLIEYRQHPVSQYFCRWQAFCPLLQRTSFQFSSKDRS